MLSFGNARRSLAGLLVAISCAVAGIAGGASSHDPVQSPIFAIDPGMHTSRITGIATAAARDLAVTVSPDRSIRTWNLETGDAVDTFRLPLDIDGDIGVPGAFALMSHGKVMLVASRSFDRDDRWLNNSVYLVFTESGTTKRWMNGAPAIFDIAFAPDDSHIAISYGAAGIDVFNKRLSRIDTVPGEEEPVLRVVFVAPDRFVTLGAEGTLGLYEIGEASVSRIGAAQAVSGREPLSAAVSPDGARLAVGYLDSGRIDLFDARTLAHGATLAPPGGIEGNLGAVGWTRGADGTPVLAAGGTARDGGGKNVLALWHDGAGDPRTVRVARDSVLALAPAGDGRIAFATSEPNWGVVAVSGADGGPGTVHAQDRSNHSFRIADGNRLSVSADGHRVRARTLGGKTVAFDVASLAHGDALSGDLRSAREQGDAIRWSGAQGTDAPRINGSPPVTEDGLPALADGERALAHDVAPGDAGVAVGTDYHLLTFDASGVLTGRVRLPAPVWAVTYSGDGRVLVATLGDGTIRWFARDTDGALVPRLGLFAHRDGRRWAAWTAEGRFAHSDYGGTDLIGYQLNGTLDSLTGQWLDLGALYGVFYDPGAVKSALGGSATAAAASLGEGDAQVLDLVRRRPKVAARSWCGKNGKEVAWTTRSLALVEGPADKPAEIEGCGAVDRIARGAELRGDGGRGVMLSPGQDALAVAVSVEETGGGVTRIDAYRDGRLVGRFDLDPRTRDAARAEDGATVEVEIPLVRGALNRVQFRAYNRSGVYAESAPILVEVPDAAPETLSRGAERDDYDERVLYVLAVGIDEYPKPAEDYMLFPSLEFAVADARDVIGRIAGAAGDAYDRIVETGPLLDGAATRDAVLAAIDTIARQADENDSVVIYFAGHGVSDAEGYAFVTHAVYGLSADTPDREIERRMMEEVRAKALTETDLIAALANMRPANVMVFLDTCYAGGFEVRGPDEMAHALGRFVLTATGDVEEALDARPGTGNGVFGSVVLDGLGGEAAVAGTVDALTLGTYVRRRVREVAQEIGHTQNAVFKAAGGTLNEFPLASH